MKTGIVVASVVPLAVVGGVAAFGNTIATQFMSGDFSVFSAVKWSSIVAGVVLAFFFLVRNGVLANENLEEGERGYRRKWGEITTKRKTGRRTLLFPGKRHFYIKHWYDVVVQSVRPRSSPEEPKLNEPVKATYNGKNVWYLLTVEWRVIDKDEAIYKSLTSVFQVNRAQEGNDALENYVMNKVLSTVRMCLEMFASDDNGLPIFTLDHETAEVPDSLKALVSKLEEENGVAVTAISPVLLSLAPEEVLRGRLG